MTVPAQIRSAPAEARLMAAEHDTNDQWIRERVGIVQHPVQMRRQDDVLGDGVLPDIRHLRPGRFLGDGRRGFQRLGGRGQPLGT